MTYAVRNSSRNCRFGLYKVKLTIVAPIKAFQTLIVEIVEFRLWKRGDVCWSAFKLQFLSDRTVERLGER